LSLREAKMQVNIPEVVAELVGCFENYERALVSNDIEAVNAMFWDSSCTVRYGTRENEIHCGHSAISAFRRARGPLDQRRTLPGTHITTFGRDFGFAVTEYLPANSSRVGRQSQTWARLSGQWKIVNAHVSFGV
jgi:Protein of unknown function (DUF3225)